MTRKTSIFAVCLATCAMAAVAFAAAGFTIKRTVKVGDTLKYRLKADLEIQGQQITFTGLSAEKVIKLEDNGDYTVETTQTEGKINMAGQEMEAPGGAPSISVYKAGGFLKEIRGEMTDSTSYRANNLNGFYEPGKEVNVGEGWTAEIKGDSKTGAVNAKVEYKVVAEEKVGAFDTLKIEMKATETEGETPAKAEGLLWLNKADWTMVKLDAKWIDMPFPGAPGPMSAKVTMTRE